MTTVSIRMDNNLRNQVEELCNSLGMSISTFFMIYAKRAVNDRAIPFQLISNDDIFYSKSNVAALEKAATQIEKGEVVNKTFEELEAIANGKNNICQ